MRKVVVTGMGAVTSIGATMPAFWDGLVSGKCGMKKIERISVEEHETTVAAEVDEAYQTEISKYWKKRQLGTTTATSQFGLASAAEAVTDCGVDMNEYDGSKVGVIFGVIDTVYEDAECEKKNNLTLKNMPNGLPALIALKFGFQGPNFSLSTACASSAYAIALGKQMIESGLCDMVVAGGTSGMVSHDTITGFNQLLAMSVNPDPETASRPFTKNRDGFIMGEGGGTIILEAEESAKKRGARIYCELAGASATCEAFNLTAPQTDGIGMAVSMRKALEDAAVSPDEVNYINAHGTSTSLNDLYETKAIHSVFGDHAKELAVSSIKAAIGHTLGACGALEGIACVKAIETGILPPTLHYDEPDEELDLDYVPNEARKADVNVAISNSFGFGGHNSTLVFRRYNG